MVADDIKGVCVVWGDDEGGVGAAADLAWDMRGVQGEDDGRGSWVRGLRGGDK
jgi:hypothetical protein